MKRRSWVLVLVLVLGLLPLRAGAATLAEAGKSAVLMDVTTGTVLYENNSHEPLAPASVTKVMTMLLIMEAVDSGKIALEDTVTASENAAAKGGSQIYLKAGETMSVSDMLKSIAVSSANDCACAMAEHIAGSESAPQLHMVERTLYSVVCTPSASGPAYAGDGTGVSATAKIQFSKLGAGKLKDVPEKLRGGASLDLRKYLVQDEDLDDKSVTWSLTETDPDSDNVIVKNGKSMKKGKVIATISKTGKLTTKPVTEPTPVTVKITGSNGEPATHPQLPHDASPLLLQGARRPHLPI